MDEDEEVPTASRRAKTRGRKSASVDARYIALLERQNGGLNRRVTELEKMEAPGERHVGVKSVSVIRDSADQPGACAGRAGLPDRPFRSQRTASTERN